jgi:DNA-binding NarL/FixJ family response regulator
MDVRLKGRMDSIDTAQLLGERFDVPVVYLTAHSDVATLQRAQHTAPFGYV